LVAAEVGQLIIVDDDKVELHNLQRQILHGHGNMGKAKVESARERLKAINFMN
jgi:molybdopterin/thiamine biosynthesis adenylyltransferase